MFIALGALLFFGVFGVVQWVLDPLGESGEDAPAIATPAPVETPPALPPPPSPPPVAVIAPLAPAAGSTDENRVVEGGGGDSAEGDPTGDRNEVRPCKIAIGGKTPVARACVDGGIAAARKEMKRLVFAAKANGVLFACDTCHEVGGTENDLIGEARDKFARMVAAAGATAAADPPSAPPLP